MPQKILFVDNSARSFYIFRMHVAKAFRQAGYEVYVMSPLTDKYPIISSIKSKSQI